MDWEVAKIIRSGNNRDHCWIKEATEIWKRAHRTENQEKGDYMLSNTWDAVLNRTTDQQGRHPTYPG